MCIRDSNQSGVTVLLIEQNANAALKIAQMCIRDSIRLFKSLSVFENVLIAHHTNLKAGVLRATFGLNRKEEKDMHEKSMELLSIVGLDHLADEVSGSLPYGMQRRLEIARALATEPKLLLLDEPAAGMNPQETLDLMAFIRDIKDRFGLTIFMIEHHMNCLLYTSRCV